MNTFVYRTQSPYTCLASAEKAFRMLMRRPNSVFLLGDVALFSTSFLRRSTCATCQAKSQRSANVE